MTERPILFNDAMVRALLAGTKVQTRRVLVPQPSEGETDPVTPCTYTPTIVRRDFEEPGPERFGTYTDEQSWPCPYGAPGDLLWVREAWRPEELSDCTDGVRFRADDGFRPIKNTSEAADLWLGVHGGIAAVEAGTVARWRPSIHMPRWAARITLAITSVRIERVQSISEEDARAEGVTLPKCTYDLSRSDDARRRDLGCGKNSCPRHGRNGPHRVAFAALWDSINGERPGCSWSANPWVWVVGFRVVDGAR